MTHPDAQYISGTPELQEQVNLLGITWHTNQWLFRSRYFVAPITVKYLVEEIVPMLKRFSIIQKDFLTVKSNHLVSSIMRFLDNKSIDIMDDLLSRQNADYPSILPQLKNRYKGLTFIVRVDKNELLVFHGNRQEPKLIVHCSFSLLASVDTISGYVDAGIAHYNSIAPFNRINDYAQPVNKDEEKPITQTKTDDEYYHSEAVKQFMDTLNIHYNGARKEYTLSASSISKYVLDLADVKYVIETLVPMLKKYDMYEDHSLILNAHLSYAIANRKYDNLLENGAIPRAIQDIMVMQQQDYDILKELSSIFSDKIVFWVNCVDNSIFALRPQGKFISRYAPSYFLSHKDIIINDLWRILEDPSLVHSVPPIPELRKKENIMPPETNVEVQSAPAEKTNMVRIKKLGTRTFDNVQFGLKLKGVAMANRKTVQLTIAAFGEDRPKWVDSERAQAVMLMIGPTVLQVVNLMIEDKESVPDMLKTLIKEAADLGQIDAAAELTETTLMPLVILVSEIVKNYLVAVGGKAAANLLTADMITGMVSSVFNAEVVKELK